MNEILAESSDDPSAASVRADAEKTRARLIAAGLKLFSAGGMDGVSTRKLAEAADVNLGAILYHFGGKEGAYLAVATHVAQTSGAELRALAELAASDAAPAAKRAAALCAGVVRVVLSTPDAALRGAFILREQIQPTAAFDILYDAFIGPLHVTLSTLVRRPGERADDPACVVRAHALLGQALGFGMVRHALMRRLNAAQLGPAELDLITRAVADMTAAAAQAQQEQGP